ncbi:MULTISPECIES: peptide cleavage/export ABC transporter [unclassified Streptococcus]|uniref:peptide cleavage/export ABC transporter n=1 Tax=unclassified Streptococcus TaxID=2608887 RepID=UPI001072B313|nr:MULTISPECIES: peptide cleavage/export ABC transporter [unclassified Streptococcus]MBF0805688.1 peptide cleavage/export ABC transporter [Streptococcus sp. 19428wA2_WM07]TFU28776.1 peptide cleavage/export ABC transporter [Streptococcus sp. WM07]
MFSKKDYRMQVDWKDCGVACLAMILSYYGSDYSLAYLRTLTKTGLNGTTAFGLVKAGEALGLMCQPLKLDLENLASAVMVKPVLVHVVKEGKFPHYYVVYQVTDSSIYLADPDPTVGLVEYSQAEFLKEWTGVSLLFEPGPEYQAQQRGETSFWSLFRLLFQERRLFGAIVTLSLCLTLLTILSSYGLQWIVDVFLPKNRMDWISQLSLCLLFAAGLQALLQFGKQYPLVLLSRQLSLKLLEDYLSHVFGLPMSFFATRRSGEILSRFTDANQIIEALASLSLTLILDGFTLISLSIALVWQSRQLFLLALLLIPLYTFLFFAFQKKFKDYHQNQLEAGSQLSSSLMDHLKDMETLKALAIEERALVQNKDYLENFWDKVCAYSCVEQIQAALRHALQVGTTVVIFWWGSHLILSGHLSLGQLLTFTSLLGYFTGPLENLLQIQVQVQKAQVAYQRLQEVYQVPLEKQTPHELEVGDQSGLLVQNVDFAYDYGSLLLKSVTLEIPPGQKLGILGVSGCGKTSLAKLLVGFYRPLEGEVKLAGQDLSAINPHALRRQVQYLAQNAGLFQGTVRDNLLWAAADGMKEAGLWEVLALVEAADFVAALPLGLDTQVGTDGTALSTGQIQRLALARTLLTGADYLILDEATSHLDSETEERVFERLLALDKTLVVITHRLDLAQRLERIVLLENGEVKTTAI